jgi:hypothetical protein
MRTRPVFLLAPVAVAVLALGAAPSASAAATVGPGQYFTGVVNGTPGNTTVPIAVQMGCFGPLRPGETGHPLAGQTLAVHQLFPPSAVAPTLGQTGNDHQIDVFFGAPPPSAAGTAGPVTFLRYDHQKALPTSLTLPCSGTGTVWFTPVPVVPPSRSAAVPVRFVSQP